MGTGLRDHWGCLGRGVEDYGQRAGLRGTADGGVRVGVPVGWLFPLPNFPSEHRAPTMT